MPRISIIIPVKNGISTIKQCLDAIFAQTLIDKTEVIIIDSGSTDGTLDIIKLYQVRLYQIPPESFNHGATRNYGVSLAKGEFVVMTVQDAIAADRHWLEKMADHFKDPKIMGVCGQQIVPHHKNKNPHAWFRPVSEPRVEKIGFSDPNQYISLSPEKKRQISSLDDVNAMYRKNALLEMPFRKMAFGEDMLWASDAFEKGFYLVYDMSARVEHYHFETYSHTYNRVITELYFEYKYFSYLRHTRLKIKDFILIFYRNFKYKAKFNWIVHNWLILFAKHKAFKDIQKAIKSDNLDTFYAKKIKSIPIGRQKNI